MTKPKSAGEIAEQLAITLDPDCRNSGDQRVFVVNKITLAIQSVIDSATCCGCAGLREALLHIFAESDETTCGFCEEIHRMAKQALCTPCACQGATGEAPVEAWRDFVEGEKPREGDRLTLEMPAYTGKQRWMRRVQERKEV